MPFDQSSPVLNAGPTFVRAGPWHLVDNSQQPPLEALGTVPKLDSKPMGSPPEIAEWDGFLNRIRRVIATCCSLPREART